MSTSERLELIAVTARVLCPRPLWEQIPRIRQAGIRRVILREKDLSAEDYTALAEKVLRACDACGVELVIHQYSQTARALGLSTLHLPLGQVTEALCREFPVVGSSVHSPEQLEQAERCGVNYVTAGHVFATDCKPGIPPRGVAFLRELCSRTKLPIYAIGGISPERLPELMGSGVRGACIMSAAMRL